MSFIRSDSENEKEPRTRLGTPLFYWRHWLPRCVQRWSLKGDSIFCEIPISVAFSSTERGKRETVRLIGCMAEEHIHTQQRETDRRFECGWDQKRGSTSERGRQSEWESKTDQMRKTMNQAGQRDIDWIRNRELLVNSRTSLFTFKIRLWDRLEHCNDSRGM